MVWFVWVFVCVEVFIDVCLFVVLVFVLNVVVNKFWCCLDGFVVLNFFVGVVVVIEVFFVG